MPNITGMETLYLQINARGKVRRAKLKGRNYLVAPLTMIVPGVMNGSAGPIYYPAEELAANPSIWNGTPIVVYHPTVKNADNTETPVSARSPEVIDKYEIGTVLNCKFENNKLTAEGWFEEDRTKEIDERIYNSLSKNQPIELSTGLIAQCDEAEEGSSFNGTIYNYIAKNYIPDHLAILPDQVGACSLSKGCGVLINGEVSHEEVREQIQTALKAKFTQADPYTYVIHVFDDHFIYEQGYKYYRLAYSKTEMGVTLSGDPVEVVREVSFVTVDNQEHENLMKLTDTQRKELVNYIVTNCECWADQTEVLNKMEDTKITKLKAKIDTDKENASILAATKDSFGTLSINELKEKAKTLETLLMNKTKESTPVTTTIANLTPEQLEDLEFARTEKDRQKTELISKLVANVEDSQKQGILKIYSGMNLNQLRVLVNALPEPREVPPQFQGNGYHLNADYSGGGLPQRTQRSAKFDPNDVMPELELDFSSK